MQIIKIDQPQQSSLPLPSATLVIDMRGVGEDVVEMLKIEVENLSSEMKLQNVRHWRYLMDILSFKAIDPLSDEDLKTLQPQKKLQQIQPSSTIVGNSGASPAQTQTTTSVKQQGLTGHIDPSIKGRLFPSFFPDSDNEQDDSLEDGEGTTLFNQSIKECIKGIDRIRNARHNAVSDLGKTGKAGLNVKDPTVRIIFLTDAKHSSSLSTAAAYAAHLKKYYHKLERLGQPSVPLSTVVLCLDHDNQGVAPARLINGLRWEEGWDHLDALIISERYREDIGRVDSDMQTLLAELLLYVLLITSPFNVRPPAPDTGTFYSSSANTDEQQVSLPPNTYLVGLATVENSTRWGYRLLNYGLAEQTIQVLRDSALVDEYGGTKNMVDAWLSDWRALVKSVIPDNVPGNIPALRAIRHATEAAKPSRYAFPTSSLLLNMGENTPRDLEQYMTNLSQTYTLHSSERDILREEVQAASEGEQTALSPTLQDAVNSIPLIQQRISEREGEDPETPLGKAQIGARRVLSHPQFFVGARGAIPRAKLQLRELSAAISTLQNLRKQRPINLEERRKALVDHGMARTRGLQKHIDSWPVLAALLRLKQPMAWLMFFIVLFLAAIAVIAGVAWLHHLVFARFPNLLPSLDTSLFDISALTVLNLVLFLVLLMVILFILLVFRRFLVDENRSARDVEIIFWLLLIVFAFSGLVISFSLARFIDDPTSLTLIAWLSFLPSTSIIMFIVALVILLAESVYFVWWRDRLQRERVSIINDLRGRHQSNIQEVVSYIADALALHLLRRAGLMDSNGSYGDYYRRMDLLSNRLDTAFAKAQFQRRLAASRLVSNTDASTLHIRLELLDVGVLKRGYKRLGANIDYKREELKEFAELLLRTMGEEKPGDIEEQLREMPSQLSREQHQLQALIGALTAVAIRFSTAMPQDDILTPLKKRYEQLDPRVASQLSTLEPLIDMLDKKVKEETESDEDADISMEGVTPTSASYNSRQADPEDTDKSADEADTSLVTQAIAAWGQMLWEKKDPELDALLALDGVMMRLQRERYNPQTVKSLLGIRTSPSGRSIILGLHEDLYLFAPPSPQSRRFLKDLLPERYVVDFPDAERLLLLHIQHYVAEAMRIPQAELGPGQPSVIGATPPSAWSAVDTTPSDAQEEDKE